MSQLVGVVNYASLPRSINQLLLLFDRLAYPFYSLKAGLGESLLLYPDFCANLDALCEAGLLFDPIVGSDDYVSAVESPIFEHVRGKIKKAFDDYERLDQEHLELEKSIIKNFDTAKTSSSGRLKSVMLPEAIGNSEKEALIKALLGKLNEFLCSRTQVGNSWALISAIFLREKRGLEAVPILQAFDDATLSSYIRKVDVAQLVFKRFPFPDESTPIEKLLDFKSDKDNQHHLVQLRRWMTGISKPERNAFEIEEEIDYLIHEYEKAMTFAKLKYQHGIFETLITVAADVLENLVRVRWGTAAKTLFSIRQRRIDLLQEEFNASGKEVAYIVKAQKAFGRKPRRKRFTDICLLPAGPSPEVVRWMESIGLTIRAHRVQRRLPPGRR